MNAPYPKVDFNIAEPKHFFTLLKPRVMSLVVFTAFVGFIVSPILMHPFLMLISLCAIALGAGASGALNMWYDADIDQKMQRTQSRPIPSGYISAETAKDFGLILSLLSVVMLTLSSNFLAGFLLAFTIFFYAVIYTMWLKRSTPQNIVIGGLAGALPPLISITASTGQITIEGLILCGIIFFWTPPHFWALSLLKKEEYKNVNIPMLPNVKGDQYTIYNILAYLIPLFVMAYLPYHYGFAHIFYLVSVVIISVIYAHSCWKIWASYKNKKDYLQDAKKSFFVSIVYLFALFFILLCETIFLKVWV